MPSHLLRYLATGSAGLLRRSLRNPAKLNDGSSPLSLRRGVFEPLPLGVRRDGPGASVLRRVLSSSARRVSALRRSCPSCSLALGLGLGGGAGAGVSKGSNSASSGATLSAAGLVLACGVSREDDDEVEEEGSAGPAAGVSPGPGVGPGVGARMGTGAGPLAGAGGVAVRCGAGVARGSACAWVSAGMARESAVAASLSAGGAWEADAVLSVDVAGAGGLGSVGDDEPTSVSALALTGESVLPSSSVSFGGSGGGEGEGALASPTLTGLASPLAGDGALVACGLSV